MSTIHPNPRVKASAYYEATIASGVTEFTTYNQMLLPVSYGDPEGEYWSLKNNACLWDVGCQRQIQLKGPDAGRLAQILCTRDLSEIRYGMGKYVALCNHAGTLINDPIVLMLDTDLYWLSISDSNILFWARAICSERKLDVEVTELDVAPLAIQGPKAKDVVASVLGSSIDSMRHFAFQQTSVEGIPILVSRSGYSKQGGFEFYLLDPGRGTELWNIVQEAGQPWDMCPGAPNHPERVESGLLSCGADNDDQTNPFEVRLGRFINLELPDEVVGMAALRRIHAAGIKRRQLGIKVSGVGPMGRNRHWMPMFRQGIRVGDATTVVWSWGLCCNIGLALVDSEIAVGTEVEVETNSKLINARLVDLPFRHLESRQSKAI